MKKRAGLFLHALLLIWACGWSVRFAYKWLSRSGFELLVTLPEGARLVSPECYMDLGVNTHQVFINGPESPLVIETRGRTVVFPFKSQSHSGEDYLTLYDADLAECQLLK